MTATDSVLTPAVSKATAYSVIALIAFNLRLAITSVPSVLEDIELATGWSDVTLGALTGIPVLCMGIFALAIPRWAARYGMPILIHIGIIVMLAAMVLRGFQNLPILLFPSAFLAGASIAILGGLVPALVRSVLAQSMGTASIIWTTSMFFGAALGGAVTPYLAYWTGSWGFSLAFWTIPVIIAGIAWWSSGNLGHARPPTPVTSRLRDLPWRSWPAWALTAYIVLNSIVYYSTVAWLAPSYVDLGYTQEAAGTLFGFFILGSIVSGTAFPWLMNRWAARRVLLSISALGGAVGLVVIALAPLAAPELVLFLFGFFLSGSFAMTLSLLSEYGADIAGSARLTAMVFFVTYTVAATGPIVSGFLFELTESWMSSFLILAISLAAQVLFVAPLRKGVVIH